MKIFIVIITQQVISFKKCFLLCIFEIDSEKKSLYGLWKKTSHDITEGMPVSRLEMLYDIITVCVKFHRDDFQQLLEVKL